MVRPVEWLDHEQLVPLFKTRQVVRYGYVQMAELRDNSEYNPELIACTRLLFRALTILDAAIDDQEATIHTARGALSTVNEKLAEAKKIRAGGVIV